MYRKANYLKSTIKSIVKNEGETIETKVERIVNNKEPIKDGAPEIFTERKEGVIAAYNIRTDRFEIAADAMDKVHASKAAKRENTTKGKTTTESQKEGKVIEIGKTEPIQGTQKQGE